MSCTPVRKGPSCSRACTAPSAHRAGDRPALVDLHGDAWRYFDRKAFFGDEATMAEASVLRMLEAGEFEQLPSVWIAQPALDENVTVEMTERLAAAYRAAGGEMEVALFPGVGHAFANLGGDDADRAIAQMAGFIAGRLSTRPAVSPGG